MLTAVAVDAAVLDDDVAEVHVDPERDPPSLQVPAFRSAIRPAQLPRREWLRIRAGSRRWRYCRFRI